MSSEEVEQELYGLLFDVGRSIRYHDRRRAFLERMHRITNFFTILMAGSIIYDVGTGGNAAWWLTLLGVCAAILASLDMVVGYGSQAALHRDLKQRFASLEIQILKEGKDVTKLCAYKVERLSIERDEPAIFRALDALCRNEQLRAEGHDNPEDFVSVGKWQRLTCNLWMWPDLDAVVKS